MEKVTIEDLKKLYLPGKEAHKGENGKLVIVGGSKLFHGASLWALKVASRIVDMVFYASIPENNELAKTLKTELCDFITVPREDIENYLNESDAILIGPGLMREPETKEITGRLLAKYKQKKWVIDAGSLTEMEVSWLNRNCLLTPHQKEFTTLFKMEAKEENVKAMAQKYGCTILFKGPKDIIYSPQEGKICEGGNQGMTKGGTGDVLAGLAAALACKNDLFLAACGASLINKKAGEALAARVGFYYNASDLAEQIPQTMRNLLS